MKDYWITRGINENLICSRLLSHYDGDVKILRTVEISDILSSKQIEY